MVDAKALKWEQAWPRARNINKTSVTRRREDMPWNDMRDWFLGGLKGHRTKMDFIFSVKLSVWRVRSGEGHGLISMVDDLSAVWRMERMRARVSREANSTATSSIFSTKIEEKV